MIQKYLMLGFRNAGLFRKHRGTKDKMFDLCESKERAKEPEFKEPITVYQISNMLHVLFGERPKPTFRTTVYDIIPYYFEKANNSYLRIDSYKDNKGNYPSETIQTKKAVGGAWSSQSYLVWERVRNLLEPALFEVFAGTIKEVYKEYDIDTNTPFDCVRKIILDKPDSRIDGLFNLMVRHKKAPIYEAVYGEGRSSTNINRNPKTQLTVLRGIDRIIRLSGQIAVPVSEDDLTKLRNNKGCATILDGGFVYIKGVKSGNVINLDNFVLVSQISTEKQ